MQPRVIIAPLNWGLGHAARCIPIIRSFLEKEWDVIIASDGDALILLQKEFPTIRTYDLPGYGIYYPYQNAVINMLVNARSFFKGIIKEHREIVKIASLEQPQLIISDNRYGVYSKNVKNIFVGHQINLKAGNAVFSKMASWLNRKMIQRFDELWIPDFEGEESMAGHLSVPIRKMPSRFIGLLSRFEKKTVTQEYEICAIISGPEPQRSLLEEELIEQLSHLNEKAIIVLGKLNENKDIQLNETTRVISHLTSKELNLIINKSRVVIARSGYSTIMDLVKLDKEAILIPTPGQTEQSYLASHLEDEYHFIFQDQEHLNIPEALEDLSKMERKGLHTRNFDVEDFI